MSLLLRNAPQLIVSIEQNLKLFRDLINRSFHKAQYGISYDQWCVLHAVADEAGISQVDIAAATKKEPASISRILNILEKKGLIDRLDNPSNRRAKRIFLTNSGEGLESKATTTFNQIAALGFKDIHPREINLFVKLIDKIHYNFSADTR